MFTIAQIHDAESNIKSGADFPHFIKTLKSFGIIRNDVFVIDGMAVYYGKDNETVETAPVYENLLIAIIGAADDLKNALLIHQQGKTDYQTFCRQAAAAGVEKWTIDLNAMTVTYLSSAGNTLLTESIPAV